MRPLLCVWCVWLALLAQGVWAFVPPPRALYSAVVALASASASSASGPQVAAADEGGEGAALGSHAAAAEVGDEAVEGNVPLLPAAAEAGTAAHLELGGKGVSMPELGPIIINADGTTRRITNWNTLTKGEQESSWRLISKRNQERLVLLERQRREEADAEQPKQEA